MLAVYTCDNCGQADDHPKLHYGGPAGAISEVYHHDCLPHRVIEDLTSVSEWETTDSGLMLRRRELIPTKKLPKQMAEALAIRQFALDGLHGDELRQHITTRPLRIAGGASGLDDATSGALLALLNQGTAFTITTPIKCLFLSAVRATATGSDTEWTTSGGYTAGTGFSGVTFAAFTAGAPSTQNSNIAVTITNAPAQTWAGNRLIDSTGTPKETFWGTLTGGNKTINAGDTCTIPSGSLQTSLG